MGFGDLFGHVLGFEYSTDLFIKGNGMLVNSEMHWHHICQVNAYG